MIAEYHDRLYQVEASLASRYIELARLLQSEKSAKLHAWVGVQDDRIQARDKLADFNALNLTVDILGIQGEIRALEAERDYIHFLVDNVVPYRLDRMLHSNDEFLALD